jgi:hypothetical protein
MRAKWYQDRPSRAWVPWVTALVAALLLQIPLLWFMDKSLTSQGNVIPSPRHNMTSVEAEFQEEHPGPKPEKFIEAELSPHEPKQNPEDELIDGTEVPIGQLVNIAPPELEELPDKAKYSARFNMKVDEEVKAKKPTKNQRVPRKPIGPKKARTAKAKKQGERGDKAATTQANSQAGPGLGSKNDSSESFSEMARKEGGLSVTPGVGGNDVFENISHLGSKFASDDYLPGVDKEGDTNLLNALSYRYIGYFERIREGVRKRWNPNRAYMRRDPRGELFGYKDRMTVLRVELDQRGYLVDTSVISSCGLKFLDEEAKRSMWAASPFLNPPKGLLTKEGKIQFNFSFTYLIAGSRNKLFWKIQ